MLRPVALALAALLLAVAGCKKESDDDNAAVAAATLESLSIDPSQVTIDVDEIAALTCLAHYSDGSVRPAAPDWTLAGPISAPSLQGTSITVTGLSEGAGTVGASFGGLTAIATVTVTCDLTDAGILYGSPYGGVTEYPAGGGTPTAIASSGTSAGSGSVLDPTGTIMYVVGGVGSEAILHKVDLQTHETTLVAYVPPPYSKPTGLVMDSQGRLYTQCYGSGHVLRVEFGALPFGMGSISVVSMTGAGGGGLAMAPGDQLYGSPFFTGTGSIWVFRHNLATGGLEMFAPTPSGLITAGALVIPSGLAINDQGEMFITDLAETRLYKHVDLDGDGFAFSPGETSVYSTVLSAGHMMFGVNTGHCGGVLLNVQPSPITGASGEVGVYWLPDLNGDGVADDSEKIRWSADYVYNGLDPSSIHGRR